MCIVLLAKISKVERVGNGYQNFRSGMSLDFFILQTSSKLSDFELHASVDYLKSLDPKNWKHQDHYAVLGLKKIRFEASDDDIRRAYRRMVLQHHPDKRAQYIAEDDYFTCITKAYEILGNSKTRRAYDSVDPEFDDSLPSQTEIDKNFYETFNKYFNLNARWSEKKICPIFGDDNAKRQDVDLFYSFWYNFKSWREFSYLDEEDKDKGQDRDERRWIDKENKATRIKRKKEEMLRIRTLVDLAYNNDKRIQKFKHEDKEKKLALKRAKVDAAQALKVEQERISKDAQLAKEQAEKAEQKRIEQIRFVKEQMKKAVKKERKLLRDKAKECNYFGNNEKESIKNMEDIEKICENFNLIDLQSLNKDLEISGKDAFVLALKNAEQRFKPAVEKNSLIKEKTCNVTANDIKTNYIWKKETLQLLIKAVNLFPAGTSQRWDSIANFINQHSRADYFFTARDVLQKAKALQNIDFSNKHLKKELKKNDYCFEKNYQDLKINTDITQTNEIINRVNVTTNDSTIEKDIQLSLISRPWTAEEQALLEQAIKSFPISTPNRWDRIAECTPNRTKKECIRRVKELVDLVNLRKDAQIT